MMLHKDIDYCFRYLIKRFRYTGQRKINCQESPPIFVYFIIRSFVLGLYILMSEDLELKQQFLRVEILQAEIDPSEFLAFLVAANTKKGDDLTLWSIIELQEVVKKFKISKNIPIITQTLPQKPQNPVKQEKIQTQTVSNYYDDNLYYQAVECITKQQNKIFSMPNFKINLVGFQKNEGGIFERSFIVYTIEIPSLKSRVNRRYSDFVWFRDTLALLYPLFPVPPLKKKGNFKRYDDKYLFKKMLILEKFLNTLVSIEQLYSEPLFESFLTIGDSKEFEKMKSQYAKLQRLTIRKAKTLKGTLQVSTQKKTTIQLVKYQQFLKQTQPQLKKIYKNFKAVATCFEQADQVFQSISTGCIQLRKKQEGIRSSFNLPSIASNSPLFMLQNLTRQYGVQLKEQARTFRKDIYALMKYQSLYRLNMLENMDELVVKQQEYNAAKLALNKKKQKLYADGKMDKWGMDAKPPTLPPRQQAFRLMLPKQSKQLFALRQTYALQNYQIYQQCYRHTKDINKILTNYMRQFIEMQVSNATRTTEIFTQISKKTLQIQKFYLSALQT